jgi:hypothetical protein
MKELLHLGRGAPVARKSPADESAKWAAQRITEWVPNGRHTQSHGYNVSGWTILRL